MEDKYEKLRKYPELDFWKSTYVKKVVKCNKSVIKHLNEDPNYFGKNVLIWATDKDANDLDLSNVRMAFQANIPEVIIKFITQEQYDCFNKAAKNMIKVDYHSKIKI